MRKTFDKKHILSICEDVDCGILAPPMKAQVAVHELCRYFLGDDWYDSSGATHPEQVNTAIVCAIEKQYKGCKIKRHTERRENMKIGNKDIKEIIVTTKDGSLVATITDENIIYEDDYKVILRDEIN